MNMPWHDQNVAGPMARDAEDCALMLDGMTGFSLKHPASVSPPWTSAYEIVAQADSLRGLRLAYVADLGGTGIDPEVARICRHAALALERDGAAVEEIAADFSDGVQPFLTLRGESMVGNHLDRLDKLERLNPNLAGNIRHGLDVKILDIARAERKRTEIFHRWRALFERYDLVLTPCSPVPPFPVEQNYPTEIAGKKLDNYIAWVSQTFLVSLATLPAASAPAGLTASRLPVGLQIVGPRFSEPRILACAKFVERVSPLGWAPHAV
jgi:amidase